MKTIHIERNKLLKNIPMILFNNIHAADEGFIDDNTELYYRDCDECKGQGVKEGIKCDECGGEGQYSLEAYQTFIIDAAEYDIERLKSYGVDVGYSEKLGLHILPIYDFGTSWSAFSYSKEVDDDYELAHDETLARQTVY